MWSSEQPLRIERVGDAIDTGEKAILSANVGEGGVNATGGRNRVVPFGEHDNPGVRIALAVEPDEMLAVAGDDGAPHPPGKRQNLLVWYA